jgi:GNAT superfamily N-acetyltransferase
MSVQIVTARPSDWWAYRELRLRSLQESPDAYGSTYAYEADFSPEVWQQRLAGATTYLAVPDGDRQAPIGTVTGLATDEDGNLPIVAMYVLPDRRGSGCAHLLLDAVADLGRQRESRRLVLCVTDLDGPAGRCYRRYGFVPTGNRHPLARDPDVVEVELAYALAVAARLDGAVGGRV